VLTRSASQHHPLASAHSNRYESLTRAPPSLLRHEATPTTPSRTFEGLLPRSWKHAKCSPTKPLQSSPVILPRVAAKSYECIRTANGVPSNDWVGDLFATVFPSSHSTIPTPRPYVCQKRTMIV